MQKAQHITERVTLPTKWERGLAGLCYFFAIIVVIPLSLCVGGLVYFTQRKRRSFLAAVGLQAALWQLLMIALLSCMNLLLNTSVKTAIQHLLYSTASFTVTFQQIWQDTNTWEHLTLTFTGVLLTVNIIVSCWGGIQAFAGRRFPAPLIGWLFARIVA